MTMTKVETMPCPVCKTDHDSKKSQIVCSCGAKLQKFVPIFFAMAPPYGWCWKAIDTKADEE